MSSELIIPEPAPLVSASETELQIQALELEFTRDCLDAMKSRIEFYGGVAQSLSFEKSGQRRAVLTEKNEHGAPSKQAVRAMSEVRQTDRALIAACDAALRYIKGRRELWRQTQTTAKPVMAEIDDQLMGRISERQRRREYRELRRKEKGAKGARAVLGYDDVDARKAGRLKLNEEERAVAREVLADANAES